MPESLNARMAYLFGMDLSSVRIHEGASAEAMGAKAYTQGTDIHFAPGQYQPNTQEGQALLGHELTHVVQQQQGRVAVTNQAKHAAADAINEDTALEREADEMGARVAREPWGADDLGQDAMDRAPAVKRDVATRVVQAKPAGEAALRSNAEQDAAALLEAMSGLGTDEQAVYRVLGQPPEVVRAVRYVYDARYNRHTGRGLVEDLRDEFGGADWEFVLGLLTRAGISVPDAALRYERQDPAAELQGGARIVASPDVRVAVPGTEITYALAHGSQSLHASSSPYRYQWYMLRDPRTARAHGEPARIDGPDGPQAEFRAGFVGNHKVICKVTPRTGGDAGVPAFYEFPQTVVPEGKLAQDALRQAPAAVEPGQQLEVLESFLQVLRAAEKQPGSAPLDAETAAAYENQIAALRKRLASTEDAERISIRAVHVDREMARVSPLRAFVARVPGGAGERETWRLVDVTNPESRRLSGEYEGMGKDAREAILAALATWDSDNRYPAGRIQLEVGAEAAGAPIAHMFQTDGMSFWDSISEFFAEVGFWTGMGAVAVGLASAVVPVPGMRIVSGLAWASILASSASATINIAQRHAEGMSSVRDDAMDLLTIAGNILAGTWMRGARVLVNGQRSTKIGTGLLIGQIGADGAQGIVLAFEYQTQYERTMAIDDPKQRTDALMELLRSAVLAGGMLFLSVQGAKTDLGQLGTAGAHGGPGRPGSTDPGGLGNLAIGSDAVTTTPPRAGRASGSEPAETPEVKALETPEVRVLETKVPGTPTPQTRSPEAASELVVGDTNAATLTTPSLKPDLGALPSGKKTQIPPDEAPENIRALGRENESAEVLAKNGYDVEQNPTIAGTEKNPDYKIGGEIFDNYAPTSDNPRNIWSNVKLKVDSGQTKRIILNLNDSKVDLAVLKKQFADWPIAGLEQVLVIHAGEVIHVWP
ncbi:eCIS core domain-containing protein [Haliangium ochraceum]|uniref:Annexin repeat protein n=1 Tax=Haliangium ochraceum (strain DSM 14365 / JCM 11303 / SMP-2) TaxID=502025 RepID=D0LS77_HALO1|nr:DUF4157 domain-containing protein [Haliangium ochraceum]ACY13774.1 Annexin repeat protein [Haliangium ochraceum DSM 14365]